MELFTPEAYLSLFVMAFFTAIISATIGMAGGTVLLSLMMLIMPPATVIPLHSVNQFVSNGRRAWLLKSSVIMNFFWPFVWGSIIGNIFSFLVLKHIGFGQYISWMIAGLILYSIFKPKQMPSITLASKGFFLVGILIGFIGLFIGAVGLILGIFLIRDDLNKHEIIATQAAMQTFNHLSKILSFFLLGFAFQDHILSLIALSLGSLLGTGIGVRLLPFIPENIFKFIFKSILVLSALKILLYDN